ncbi:uncharacterized protein LOC100907654 [Galendromus occidentalis]|uniref:Uncharacterized protein LOC100907654 n=1 Tax=Galendromus occidentalis TaxID=34638 RepID=A0AAJ6VXG5_9ACAR|nr:uncharacterized protein LOC100907654 [Galendromus occidentalis]
MLHLPKSSRYSTPRSAPRIPPIAIAGLAICACIGIVIYWHLISENHALEERYRELQEKFHLFVDKKETLQRQYKELRSVSQDASKKLESSVEKYNTCEKEKVILEETLRSKQQELDACTEQNKKHA